MRVFNYDDDHAANIQLGDCVLLHAHFFVVVMSTGDASKKKWIVTVPRIRQDERFDFIVYSDGVILGFNSVFDPGPSVSVSTTSDAHP